MGRGRMVLREEHKYVACVALFGPFDKVTALAPTPYIPGIRCEVHRLVSVQFEEDPRPLRLNNQRINPRMCT